MKKIPFLLLSVLTGFVFLSGHGFSNPCRGDTPTGHGFSNPCRGTTPDVTVTARGELRLAFGGGITARPLVNYDNWKAAVVSEFALRDVGEYDLKSRGEIFGAGRWSLHACADGSVLATNRFTLTRAVKAQACGTRIYLPYARFRGRTWRVDDGTSGTFPTNTLRAGLFSGKSVRSVQLMDGEETIVFSFPEPRTIHLSNDAAWCDAFSLRLQKAGSFNADTVVEDVFTISVRRRLTCSNGEPIVAARGPGWVPIQMRKGVVPGGATDFSGWGLQDAPAGRHGWLKRVGGHFEFPDAPGRAVRFYGVNLVSGCCWPENKADADDMVARLVRSGYNTVRLHHFECAGGITSNTGDPTGTALNPKRMDQMDYLVAQLIKHGIYVTIDLYSYRTAPWKAMGVDKPGSPTFMQMKALIHVTDAGFGNWCGYAANLLNHVNPYTGRAYKDEPGLPLICLVNEAGLQHSWNVTRELPQVAALFKEDVAKLTPAKIPAFDDVAAQVEGRSLARMVPFLRGLGVKALLTDVNNGPYTPQMNALRERWLDYNDNHFYVDHPNWLGVRLRLPYKNRNLHFFDYNGESPLERAAKRRLPSLPYTITEWNFSGPAHFRHQGGLLTASLAAEGAWDGLWCFTWAHGLANLFEGRNPSGIGNFDVLLDPVAQANERALVALYLRGDAATGVRTLAKDIPAKSFTVDTPRTQGGAALAGTGFATKNLSVRLKGTDAAVWATAVDGQPLAESKRILLSHVTDVQNDGMRWADEKRTVILSRGKLPLLAAVGQAEISLAASSGSWTCWALETDGTRREKVPVVFTDSHLVFTADVARSSSNATFLYELLRAVDGDGAPSLPRSAAP